MSGLDAAVRALGIPNDPHGSFLWVMNRILDLWIAAFLVGGLAGARRRRK